MEFLYVAANYTLMACLYYVFIAYPLLWLYRRLR